MTNAEIAWVLHELLSDTRTYCGVQFARNFDDCEEELRYLKGLVSALPNGERIAVEASFNRIYDALVYVRAMDSMDSIPDATHLQRLPHQRHFARAAW